MPSIRTASLSALASLALIACGGGADDGVGPGDTALIGTWSLIAPEAGSSMERAEAASGIRTRNATIIYRADGTSDFLGDLSLADGDDSVADPTYRIDADVTWTLEETILTRTLVDVAVDAVDGAPAEPAEQIANAMRGSPPAQFIIETLDETTLVVLDPDTGATTRYARQ